MKIIDVPFENFAGLKRVLPKSGQYTNIMWTWLPRGLSWIGPGISGDAPIEDMLDRPMFTHHPPEKLEPGYTFNPWRGCVKVSPACKNCYAESTAKRNPKALGEWGKDAKRIVAAESYWKGPERWNKVAEKAGRRVAVFTLSMGDLFEEYEGPPENIVSASDGKRWLDDPWALDVARLRLFSLMMECQWILWMTLTKRPENTRKIMLRCRNYLEEGAPLWQWLSNWIAGQPPNNVWMGTTVEGQDYASRIEDLGQFPARRRFLSCEPLLDDLDLSKVDTRKIHWVIPGGESGPNWREESSRLHRYRLLRDQCKAYNLAFFMKQSAGTRPQDSDIPEDLRIRQYPSQ